MKKLALAALILAGVLSATGCQKDSENKYSYRDAGIDKLEAGDYEAAVTSFDEAISHSNGLVGKFELDVLKYRAEAEYRLEDYTSAAHTYDVLVQADDEKAEYLYMRGLCYALTGNWEGGLEDYTRANVLDKNVSCAKQSLEAVGVALEDNGQTDKAMVLYQQAVSDGVQSAQVYNRMGLCKLKEKAYEDAIGYFELGLKLDDSEVSPLLSYNRAVAYEYKGDFDLALQYMQEYTEAYGTDEKAEREIEFLKTR